VHRQTKYSKEEALKARDAAQHVHDAVKEALEDITGPLTLYECSVLLRSERSKRSRSERS